MITANKYFSKEQPTYYFEAIRDDCSNDDLFGSNCNELAYLVYLAPFLIAGVSALGENGGPRGILFL